MWVLWFHFSQKYNSNIQIYLKWLWITLYDESNWNLKCHHIEHFNFIEIFIVLLSKCKIKRWLKLQATEPNCDCSLPKNYVMRVSIYLKAEINIYQRNVLDHQLSFAKVSTKGWRHCQNLWPDTFNCDDTLRIKASSSIIFYGVGGSHT